MNALPEIHYRHWTEPFLDVGYERGGIGPKTYDCWTYFGWVQRERFGRSLSPYFTPPTLRGIARAMQTPPEEFGWHAVERPTEGDAVLMSHLRHATHIGIWTDLGRVLHCPEGGAVLHDAFHLKAAGWRLRGFFTPMAGQGT